MAGNFERALEYWRSTCREAEAFRRGYETTERREVNVVNLKEKYVTENGTHVFSTPGSDLEFVLVERHRMLWYLGAVQLIDFMGVDPQKVEPVEPDQL